MTAVLLRLLFVASLQASAHARHRPRMNVTSLSSSGLAYLLAVPAHNCTSAPVLLFLHGAGESGAGDAWGLLPGYDQRAGSWSKPAPVRGTPPGLAVDSSPLARGFVIVSPRTDRGWGAATHEALLSLLEEVLRATPCADGRRVVLTGISMGGAGAWALGAAHPGRFAGVAPVCGYSSERGSDVASALRGTPLWVVHGSNDVVIDVEESRTLVAATRVAGNERVIYHEVEGQAPEGYPSMLGHDSWTQAYGDESFWEWARAPARHEA
jgi:predicted peptidase